MSLAPYALLLLVALVAGAAQAAPLQPPVAARVDAELSANYFEGDIELNAAQLPHLLHGNGATRKSARNGLTDMRYRWPNRTVYYRISTEFSAQQVAQITGAIQHLQSHSCLHFRAATSHTAALLAIRPHPDSCSSAVGYQGRPQRLQLAAGCFRLGTIAHELLHALGFWHQHSAADRDRYVRILSANIAPGKEHNFRRHAASHSFGLGYDYGSVMHYSAYAFSRNGQPTIVGVDGRTTMGQRVRPSAKDLEKLRKMYAC